MTPDRNSVAAFLRKLEQGIHRKGWDEAPLYATLRWLPDVNAMTVYPIPLPIGNPVDCLVYLADVATSGDAVGKKLANMGAAKPYTFFGQVLVSESWTNREVSSKQYVEEGKSLADIVGSYESRDVFAFDIRGNAYGLHRKRGEKPVELESGSGTGRILQALHAITLAIAEQLPAGLADLDALRRPGLIPTCEELDARHEANRA